MERAQQEIRDHIDRVHGPDANVGTIDSFVSKQNKRSLAKKWSFERDLALATAPVSARDNALGTVAASLINLRNEYLILYQVLERKITYLATSSTCAFSNNDHLLLVLCAKGLIENTGSVLYLNRMTEEAFARIESAATPPEIN